jgi:hypothetical protein
VLKLLLERLRNEITRLAAVKALATLAHSSLDLGLQHTLDASLVSPLVLVCRLYWCPTWARNTHLMQAW